MHLSGADLANTLYGGQVILSDRHPPGQAYERAMAHLPAPELAQAGYHLTPGFDMKGLG